MNGYRVPAASGAFTQALFAIFDTDGRYGQFIGTVRNYGITIVPDDWVPWLIYDLGLEDAIPYVRNFRRVLAEGPAWQARRGTDDGIEIGIGWVDSAGTVEPGDGRHDWWEFQVRFPEPPADLAQVRQLDGIIRLSKAAEDDLFRLFSPDYDHRPVRMDQHRADTGGWFDGYSGRPRWDGGPLISFGRSESGMVDLGAEATGGAQIETTALLSWFEGPRYDIDRFGAVPSAVLTHGEHHDGGTELAAFDGGWPTTWPTTRWPVGGDPGPFVYVGLAAVNDDTILFTLAADTWPVSYPAGTWADAADITPIQTASERS